MTGDFSFGAIDVTYKAIVIGCLIRSRNFANIADAFDEVTLHEFIANLTVLGSGAGIREINDDVLARKLLHRQVRVNDLV
jgi:hypothetical protein